MVRIGDGGREPICLTWGDYCRLGTPDGPVGPEQLLLNDTLVEWYLRFKLEKQLRQLGLAERTYIFSPFFIKRLRLALQRRGAPTRNCGGRYTSLAAHHTHQRTRARAHDGPPAARWSAGETLRKLLKWVAGVDLLSKAREEPRGAERGREGPRGAERGRGWLKSAARLDLLSQAANTDQLEISPRSARDQREIGPRSAGSQPEIGPR